MLGKYKMPKSESFKYQLFSHFLVFMQQVIRAKQLDTNKLVTHTFLKWLLLNDLKEKKQQKL